ncbi:MAG: response regulator [Burkholderiaceae bacterium]
MQAALILVVDDSNDVADSMALILEMAGFRTGLAYDGRAALAAIADKPPDAVLLDLSLPDIDGCELARQIRRGQTTPPLLIALTGEGSPEKLAATRAAGFDAHLVKPVDPDVVTRLLIERGLQPQAG